MARFRVIVSATGMNIPPDGATGFTTTRFVHAGNAADAERQALDSVEAILQSEPAFASSKHAHLAVYLVERVRNPFRRSHPNGGFTFVAAGAAIEDALEIEIAAGAGWLP